MTKGDNNKKHQTTTIPTKGSDLLIANRMAKTVNGHDTIKQQQLPHTNNDRNK
jgi:hypothetical protein